MQQHSSKATVKTTLYACYLGFIVQAVVVNLTPILFIPLRELYGFSYEQLGLLVLVNFVTQVSCDIAFSGVVDKYGYRPFILATSILCTIGWCVFALSPVWIPGNIYLGLIIGTILFSGAGGLLELLLSPLVNALPLPNRAQVMSLLHSFYAWGQVGVVALTTLGLWLVGVKNWQYIVALWMILPMINLFLFLRAPMPAMIPEGKRQGMAHLARQPFFWVAVFVITMGGASEQIAAQWMSAFLEKGTVLPKIVGDMIGVAGFALMLGIGRSLHGAYGEKVSMAKLMMIGFACAVGCYFVIAFSPISGLSIAACVACGLSVSLLWPGTLVVAAQKFPLAGAWMFAILAAGGDIGASIGPALTGVIVEKAPQIQLFMNMFAGMTAEQVGLRAGMMAAAVFPALGVIAMIYLKKHESRDG